MPRRSTGPTVLAGTDHAGPAGPARQTHRERRAQTGLPGCDIGVVQIDFTSAVYRTIPVCASACHDRH
jgi:hypothetical protein